MSRDQLVGHKFVVVLLFVVTHNLRKRRDGMNAAVADATPIRAARRSSRSIAASNDARRHSAVLKSQLPPRRLSEYNKKRRASTLQAEATVIDDIAKAMRREKEKRRERRRSRGSRSRSRSRNRSTSRNRALKNPSLNHGGGPVPASVQRI